MAEVEQSVSKRLNEEKIIADPIHGMMAFEPYLLKIINHRYFQRLRNIKQMQGVEHVYPGGVHSRFSHSLGVCYLAGKVLDTLEKYETIIEEDDKMCVKIAALCHDIGHGPYSHLYETVVNEQDGVKWEHEDQSLKITEVLLKKLGIFNDEIRDKAIEKIKTMIKGKKVEDMTDEEREKAFLFQVVSNKNNGVDVDKWDYFCRDAHACGFPNNFHKDRATVMVRTAKLSLKDGKTAYVLAFPKKDEINIYNMYGLRYTLHSRVAFHPVVCCVHEMIADVLKYTDKTKLIKFKGESYSPNDCRTSDAVDQYCMMDDRIINLIYNCKAEGEDITKARDLIERILRRDFYQCIGEIHLRKKTDENQDKEIKQKIQEIVISALKTHKEQEGNEDEFPKKVLDALQAGTLASDEIIRIKIQDINYGNKDKNPIKNVYFYQKGKSLEVMEYVENFTPMVPQCFQKKTIQIICTLSKNQCRHIDRQSIIESVNAYIEELEEESTTLCSNLGCSHNL